MAGGEPTLTLGVEEEYFLVDRRTRQLVVEQPAELMPACKRALGDQVTHELLTCQIEIGTKVCADIAEVRQELRHLRRTVAGIAGEHGLAIIAASTHPSGVWDSQTNTDAHRYRTLTHDFQALARRLLVCGMHVHAGIEDQEERIDLLAQATWFLPHLLALSASSPFWEGRDTGMKAFRPTITGDMPRSGLPETMDSWKDWETLVAVMRETGVCNDPTQIWWDARPSWKVPTLELRIPDVCTRIDDALTVAALWQSLLATLARIRRQNQTWRRHARVLIHENKWRAQRWGAQASLADYARKRLVPMDELTQELIAMLNEEAQRLGCRAEIEHALAIARDGSSADRQLAVFRAARGQGANLIEARDAVVDWLMGATVEGL